MYFRRKTADYFRSNFSSIQTLILRFGYLWYYRQFWNLFYKFNIDCCHNYVHRKMATHDSSIFLTVHRYCLIVAVVSMLLLLTVLIRLKGFMFVLKYIIYVLLLFCIIPTSTAYFKIFKIIRRHQQQVQANESSQNFGQPAIDILKYRKSVFSILYILGVFYPSYLPFFVTEST